MPDSAALRGRPVVVSSPDRWIVLAAVLAGLFNFGSVMTILGASLATVGDDLHSSTSLLAWAITAPFLALAVGNPIFGKLGDIYGRRGFYLGGISVFAVATLGCGLAPSGGVLIALRTVAGLGAAACIPTGMALVLDAFAPVERPRALGWFNLVGTGAPALGLAVGGLMIDALGWRSVFFIYGSIAVVATVGGAIVIKPVPGRERVPIDVLGSLAMGLATLAAMLGLTLGASRGFTDPACLALLVAAPMLIYWFVRIERATPHPLVPLRYFARRNFAGPLVGYFAGHIAYMGAFVVTPILLGDVFGFSAAAITAILFLRLVMFALSSPVGGSLSPRLGERNASVVGSLFLVFGMGAFAVGATTEVLALVLVGLATSGIAFGLVSPPYAAAITTAADPEDLSLSTGMLQTAASLGTVTGVQSLVLLLGDSDPHTGHEFLTPYLVAVAVAVVMVVASSTMRRYAEEPFAHELPLGAGAADPRVANPIGETRPTVNTVVIDEAR